MARVFPFIFFKLFSVQFVAKAKRLAAESIVAVSNSIANRTAKDDMEEVFPSSEALFTRHLPNLLLPGPIFPDTEYEYQALPKPKSSFSINP